MFKEYMGAQVKCYVDSKTPIPFSHAVLEDTPG